ncbi:MAG: MBG domain-containing protein, partial [Daejeonella sp.]
IGGDSFTGSLSRTAGESVAGSPYAINQGTVTAGGNYNLSFIANNFSISQKPITITADAGQIKAYGLADPTLTYNLTSGSLESNDSLTGSLSRTAGETVAGSPYAISQGTVTAGSNYNLSFIGADFNIITRLITITADNKSKIYGSADPALTYTLTSGSLETNDSFTGSLSRTSGESVVGSPYAISQGSLTAGSNYSLNFIGADLTIITKPIIITADAKSKVYGSADPALTYTLTSGSLETNDSFTGSLSRATGESVVGSPYAISQGSLTAGSNYSINFIGADFDINKATLTITADNKSKVQGTVNPAFTASYSGFINQEDSNILTQEVVFVTDAETASVPGDYVIIPSGAAADNYTITYVNGTLTIVPAALSNNANLSALAITDGELNETFDPNTLIYTASVANTTATIQVSPTVADQTALVTVNGNAPSTPISLTEAGTTDISIVVTAQDNTTKTYTLQVTRPAANAVDQTITFDPIQPKTYGDAAFNLGTVNSSAGLAVTYIATDPTIVNIAGNVATILKAGTTSIRANQAGNINTNPAPEVIQTLVVGKAALTINADNKNKTQGTANPVFTVSYSSFVNDDDSNVLTQQPVFATTATTASVAGTYDITVSGAVADNYDITYVNGTLTVIPGALSANADLSALSMTGGELNEAFNPNTLAYTASVANTTASIQVTPTVADQTASVTVNGNDPSDDVNLTEGGITDISIVVTAQDNITKTYTLQVTRPAANAGDQTISFASILPKAYGDAAFNLGPVNSSAGLAVTYTAADPAVVNIAGNVATILKAGTTVITASQAGNANFNPAPDVEQTLTVSPKAITVTANANQSKIYSSADPVLAYNITSGALVNGDTFTGYLSRSAGETVAGGPYDINQGTLTAGSNYTLTFVGTYFTINKASLTITANNKSKTYGDVFMPASTDFKTSVLEGGDTVTSATITSTGSAATASVNNYPINISVATGTGLSNYNITYIAGNLIVGKAPLIIAADNKSRVQGTANPVFNAIYTGFLNGDDNTSGLSVQPTLATSATAASAAGTYAITASGAVAANYAITYVNGTLTVTPGTGSSNANLSNLSISSGTGFLFVPGTLTYSASVSNATTSIAVIPTTADANATIKVNGVTVASGSSLSVSLMTGINSIITEITAQNGTVKTYTLTINRLEANAPELITASNIMSPNGDGINDLWMIKDIELYPNNEVSVYDREGRIIFSQKSYDNTWNASINGSPLNTGTYYYIVNFGPTRGIIKGFITIVREQ